MLLRLTLRVLVILGALIPLELLANLPPIAVSDQHYTYKNETVDWTVADNDSDPNGDVLTYTVLTPPPANKGTWNLNSNGSYTFIPYPFTWGPVNMTYQVCDPGGLCATATLTMYVIFINDAPIINNDTFYVPGNASFQGNVSANDIEPDGEVLFYSVMLQPAHGTLQMGQFGAFTYTPNQGYQGPDQFIVNGCDPCQACFNSTASITVGPPNGAPVATSAIFSGQEDTQINGSLAGNATDPNMDPITFSLLAAPASGNLVLNASGSFTYSPALNFFGTLSATFQVCDPFGACASGQITITILPVNDAPVCVNDFNSMDEDGVLAGDVFANDVDPDGNSLSYSVVSGPQNGSILMGAQGTFQYAPGPNFYGNDQISYSATDPSGAVGTGILFITVSPVNDAPVCQDVSASINKNSVFIGNVSLNNFDVDDTNLIYQLIVEPQNGTLQLAANGNCTYTPNYNYFGTEIMTYRATDPQGAFGEALLIIEVIYTDSGPVAQADFFTTLEDTPMEGDLSLNDLEPDDEQMTFVLTTQPINGSIVFNSNGSFTYTPDQDFNGIEQMNYVVSDPSGNSDTSVLSIEITPVNDAPVCVNSVFQMLEDNVLTGMFTATDVDNDALEFFASIPLTGQLTLQPSTGSFTFLPAENFFGSVQLIFTIADPSNAQCIGSVSIEVLPVNDAPVCADDYFSGVEDQSIIGNVSGNDIDVDNVVLDYSVIQMPSNGSLIMMGNGSFVYTPNLNFHGLDQAICRATDAGGAWDEATIHFNISPVNDAPTTSNQVYNIFWNESITSSVVASDIDGDVLNFQLNSLPSNGTFTWGPTGSFTYVPSFNFFGTEVLSVSVCDADICVDIALTINVYSENVPPVAIDDFFVGLEDELVSGSVATNDFDLNFDVLAYDLMQGPLNGIMTWSANGTFVYTPNPNWNGVETFTYQVCDTQNGCETATLTITIQSVNDAPEASNGSVMGQEDTEITGNLGEWASDVDADALAFSLVSGSPFGIITVQPSGTFSYSPTSNYNGTSSIVWQVCDIHGACAQGVLTILVTPVNDAPIANNDIKVIAEDNVATGNVMSNDYDPDGNPLSATVIVGPASGTFVLNSVTGGYTYTPFLHFNGMDTVVYQVCDPSGLCSQATLVITVLWMNDTPVAVADNLEMNHNQIGFGDLNENDFDVDDEPLFYSVLLAPFNGTFDLDSNGTFIYTPNLNFVGSDMATYMVCDSCNACAVSNLFINVNFLNNPPLAENDFFTMGKNTTLSASVGGNDTDVQNDLLTFSLISNPQNGSISFNSDGTFTYTPNLQFSGNEVLTYSVCDIHSACTEATLIIQVLDVNSPPIFTAPIILACESVSLEIHLDGCVSDAETVFSNLTFDNLTATTGIVSITNQGFLLFEPESGFTGLVNISFEACDNDATGALCTVCTLDFNVNPIEGEVELTDVFITDVLCHGDVNGSISLFASPVSANSYQWENGSDSSEISGLGVGIYSVTIASSTACLAPLIAEFTVNGPSAPLSVEGLSPVNISENPGGSSGYTVNGGTAPYSFVWTDNQDLVVSTSQFLSGLNEPEMAGTYNLLITDANGCQFSETILITGVQEFAGSNTLSVFPNPSPGLFNFVFDKIVSGQTSLKVFDYSGRLVKQSFAGASDNFAIDMFGEAPGFYTYSVESDSFVFRGVIVLR